MVICVERGADLHMAQLMPLPLTVSCFSKNQIGFTFLVPAHLGSPGKGPLNGCVCAVVNFDFGERFPRPMSQQRGSLRPRTRRVAMLGVGLLMPNPALGGNLGQKIN